jgi:hypothetical protein
MGFRPLAYPLLVGLSVVSFRLTVNILFFISSIYVLHLNISLFGTCVFVFIVLPI